MVAVITYQNPEAFPEQVALGHQTWPEYQATRPPDLSGQQVWAVRAFEDAIEQRDVAASEAAQRRCRQMRVPEQRIYQVTEQKRLESESAGVCLAYLLSEEFADLARRCSGKEDPTFIDLKEPFFLSAKGAGMGEGRLCPRDHRPGCAIVDTLPAPQRRKATHFMSWVWKYNLSVVRSGLSRWAKANDLAPDDVFLFCCFFCNNQWRILVEGSSQGSDNLEQVFEARLRQIGRVVAVMDTWQNPTYTQRIWTIFEQYMAARLKIETQFTLPEEPSQTLLQHLYTGEAGIKAVIKAVSNVDAQRAEASVPQDETKVKSLIESSIGFAAVNERVQQSLTAWVASEFRVRIDQLVVRECECIEHISQLAPSSMGPSSAGGGKEAERSQR